MAERDASQSLGAYSPGPEEAAALREQVQAERILARMDLLEDMAKLAESEVQGRLKDRLRGGYRRVIGCFPENREDVRAALERIRGGERGSIEDIFRSHTLNRS